MTVEEFNKEFEVEINEDKDLTLSELIQNSLGHHPSVGDSIFINPFEITVKETTLLDIKMVHVTNRLRTPFSWAGKE